MSPKFWCCRVVLNILKYSILFFTLFLIIGRGIALRHTVLTDKEIVLWYTVYTAFSSVLLAMLLINIVWQQVFRQSNTWSQNINKRCSTLPIDYSIVGMFSQIQNLIPVRNFRNFKCMVQGKIHNVRCFFVIFSDAITPSMGSQWETTTYIRPCCQQSAVSEQSRSENRSTNEEACYILMKFHAALGDNEGFQSHLPT